MRRSPVVFGLVLGTIVGAAGAAVLAATDGRSESLPKLPFLAPARAPAGRAPGPSGLEYRVRGRLPDLDGRSRAYTLGTRPGRGAVERLATALGVHGAVRADANGWTVREQPRLVRVDSRPGLPWFLATFPGPCVIVSGPPRGATPVPSGAGSPVVTGPASRRPNPGSSLPPVHTDCPETDPGSVDSAAPARPRPADLPSREEAERTGYEALRRAGVGRAWAVQTFDLGSAWRVEVDPAVDGVPAAGYSWRATVGPGGRVVQASGYLARPSATDAYPLVGTKAGLERLREVAPVRLPPTPCCNEVPGTVVVVKLGLMHVGANLVPAYLFELEGAPTPVAVPAVEDRYLKQPL
jgi:hypothetical protein